MTARRIALRAFTRATLAFVALLTCATAVADPPARAARMAVIDGPVTFSPAGEDDWVLATLNRPLITGDRVWTDADARTELQIGSLAARLGSQTSVAILNLDDRVAQFQLQQGALNLRVRRLNADETIEIDTPLLAFSVRRPGTYRVDVDAVSGATTIAVRSGEGEAYGDGAAYTIGDRQWYRFMDSALRDYEYDALPPYDAFDAWAQARDRHEEASVAARYVAPDVIGVADLDQYGTWSAVEGYGNVWVPTDVDRDWAPYRDGRWAWIEPWGWTWIDAAPWGFAPFHYGRWAYARERWCWVPGPPHARAVYAPALVAFVGGGDFRVSAGGGATARGVAWFPLAPGEVYRPSYRVSRDYFTNVNVSNTNVTNNVVINVYNRPEASNAIYLNRRQRGGVTAVSAVAFAQSRSVAQSALPVARMVATASPVSSFAPVAPVRESVLGGNGGAAAGVAGARQGLVLRPPAAVLKQPAVARAAPPPPTASFATRESALAKDPGRPSDTAAILAPRSAASNASTAPTVKLVAASQPGVAPPLAPTARRSRTNGPPQAGGATALTPPPGPASVPAPKAVNSAPSGALPPPVSGVRAPPRPDPEVAAPRSNTVPQRPAPLLRPPPPPQPTSSAQGTAATVPAQPLRAPADARQAPNAPATIPGNAPTSGAPTLQGEVRRERPPVLNGTAPTATVPSQQPRREVRPPPVPRAPPAEILREGVPQAVNPPPVGAQPAMRGPSPPAPPAPPQPLVRQPEARTQVPKGEAPKAKPEEKRDEPK